MFKVEIWVIHAIKYIEGNVNSMSTVEIYVASNR